MRKSRLGIWPLAALIAGGCAGMEFKDRKPEVAREDGYFVPADGARERGGVGDYAPRTGSGSERQAMREEWEPRDLQVRRDEEMSRRRREQELRIYFDRGSATLKPEARQELDRWAENCGSRRTHPDPGKGRPGR